MDRTTGQYVEECLRPGSRLRFAAEEAQLPPVLTRMRGQRILPRPLLATEKEVSDFADDLGRIFDLLVSLPNRLFDGDLTRYCAALGIDERQATLMCRMSGGPPVRYGRADMYHDGTSFRLLEFNVASQIGGVDRAGQIPRALLQVPALASFAAEHGLGFSDTGWHVAEAMRAAGATVSSGREPTVVLLEAPGELAAYRRSWEPFQELMRGFELDFHLAELGDLRSRNGRLFLDGRPVDVVLRCFGVEQICHDPATEALVEPIVRAHQEGQVVLWTPLDSNLYGNKGCLAMLSDPGRSSLFSTAERALIDRVLPWTRSLDDATAGFSRAHREELILKPRAGYGGIGVTPGWELSDEQWAAALDAGRSAGAVVQQRVVPRPEPVVDPATGLVADWHASWGAFLTPAGYAGAYARALPSGDSAVIGITSNPETRTAGVFTVR